MPFDGRLLSGVSVLAAVVESGNFVRAGEALSLSPSGVSRAIARLEARIGIRLLHRTTRAVRLTDEGARFYGQVIPLLSGIEEAAALAGNAAERVQGRLRVSIDPPFARMLLAPRLHEFTARHPALELELITRDVVGDVIGEGMDMAVLFGEPPDSSLAARKLLSTRVLTVAAPGYLERHGRPAHPTELEQHDCIQFRDPLSGRAFPWEFHRARKILPVKTRGTLLLNDSATMIAACLAGSGIAQVLALRIHDLIETAQLIELFPDWPGETFPLYAFYPSRRHLPAKVRVFIDFCVEVAR
ncbi:MAG TPA: LysR family transcriptional regulator [Dokdonella sp.]